MIRPRLRPTVSRRIKYIGIAPTAQKKLGKEARRGSHDLRRLVGHANFLDLLVDSLEEEKDEEPRGEDVISPGPQDVASAPCKAELSDLEDLDDDSDSDAEGNEAEWSDSSDDDDHALSRTPSGRPGLKDASSREASPGKDYFSQPLHREVTRKADALRMHAERSISGGGKKEEDEDAEDEDYEESLWVDVEHSKSPPVKS